jgi:acetoin utilization deacetylase AcuC-like enzyme
LAACGIGAVIVPLNELGMGILAALAFTNTVLGVAVAFKELRKPDDSPQVVVNVPSVEPPTIGVQAPASPARAWSARLADRTLMREAVETVLETEFREKYHAGFYVARQVAEERFHDFVRRNDDLCLVVTGSPGKGKSNFICHLSEILGTRGSVGAVLIPATALDLESPGAPPLEVQVLGSLARRAGKTPPAPLGREDFDAWCAALDAANLRAVVFIDAINELRGAQAPARFNAEFDLLLERVSARGFPVRFCVSCRSDAWRDFVDGSAGRPAWAGRDPEVLGEFNQTETAEAFEKYHVHFGSTVIVDAEARQGSYDPLMLRLLFSAARNAENRTLRVASLRRKAVLDEYAAHVRRAVSDHLRAVGGGPGADAADLPLRLTRYLVSLAGRMYREGRAWLHAREVLEEAKRLEIPDSRLDDPEALATDSGTALRGMLDAQILRRDATSGAFSFVFETYFEYALGRYFALVEWPERTPESVRRHLEDLLAEHHRLLDARPETEVAVSEGVKRFHHLAAAIPFAVLVLATDEELAGRRAEVPDLLLAMVRTRRLDWTSFALATVRELAAACPAFWNGATEVAAGRFAALLELLDRVTETAETDFVIVWDVRDTLQQLARVRPRAALEHALAWLSDPAAPVEALRPFLAIHALQGIGGAGLGDEDRARLVGELAILAEQERFRRRFWMAQPLVAAAVEIAAPSRDGGSFPPGLLEDLRAAVLGLADEASPPVRAQALAALPLLSGGEEHHLAEVLRRLEEVEDPWAWWNTAYALHAWPAAWSAATGGAIRILERASEPAAGRDGVEWADVRYAAAAAAEANPLFSAHAPRLVAQIRQRVDPRRAGLVQRSGSVDPELDNCTGVVYHPALLKAGYGGHVECRERIQAMVSRVEALCGGYVNRVIPRPATDAEIRAVHGGVNDRHRDGSPWPEYVAKVLREDDDGGRPIPMEDALEFRSESLEAARLSAGAVLAAIDYVRGGAPAAWALNRPPGHLANNKICILNNVAIGARYALGLPGIERVLVVDCDAHHGKHTDRVFSRDRQVVYFSMHIDQGYTREEGTVEHTGHGEGDGYSFNLPYPPYLDDEGYAQMVDALLVPVARDFAPDLILLSAGFDSLAADPLTPQCTLTERGYVHLARRLGEVARERGIKLVATLEGGYALDEAAATLVHMMNAFGDWQISEERIGRTARAETRPEARDLVKATVRRRLELMAERKAREPEAGGYFYDPGAPHWRAYAMDGEAAREVMPHPGLGAGGEGDTTVRPVETIR